MQIITEEKFKEIMNKDASIAWDGDNALQGLKIIEKYMPEKSDILAGADHDIIYSVNVEEILNAGLTEEDANKLSRINWMIQDDYLACYV